VRGAQLHDAIEDGDETDVDCGHNCALQACGRGKKCNIGNDCDAGSCDGGYCD